MKITLDHNGIKRSIDGEFSICMSRTDMERICILLKNNLMHEFSFGWIEIRDNLPFTPNQSPLPWHKD